MLENRQPLDIGQTGVAINYLHWHDELFPVVFRYQVSTFTLVYRKILAIRLPQATDSS